MTNTDMFKTFLQFFVLMMIAVLGFMEIRMLFLMFS